METARTHHLVFGHYPREFTSDDFRRLLAPFQMEVSSVDMYHSKEPHLTSVVGLATWSEVSRIKSELDYFQGLRVKIVY